MLDLLEQAVARIPNASKVKEVAPTDTRLRDLPCPTPARSLLEFSCSSDGAQLSYLCCEVKETLILLCLCLAVVFESQQQEQIEMVLLDANITLDYGNVNVFQRPNESLVLIAVARFYKIKCSPDILTQALYDIHKQYFRIIANLGVPEAPAGLSKFPYPGTAAQKSIPVSQVDLSKSTNPSSTVLQPQPVSQSVLQPELRYALLPAGKKLTNDIKNFLSHTGFKNIKISEGNTAGILTCYLLVIAQVDDDEMPAPTRTFPIRFEVNFEFKVRLFISKDRSVATFPKPSAQALADKLTELLQPNYVYVCDDKTPQSHSRHNLPDNAQLHLVRTLPLDYFSQNCDQCLNEVYHDAIRTIKWTVSAPYQLLIVPDTSVPNCLAKIMHRNPANPTHLPVPISMSRQFYQRLISYLQEESLPHFLGYPSTEGEALNLQQCLPLDYISVSEAIRDNPSDAPHFLAEATSLSIKAQRKAGIPLSIEMFAYNKQTRKPALLLSSSGIEDNVEACPFKNYEIAQQLFLPPSRSHDPLHLWLSVDTLRFLTHHSQSILTGEHCGRKVRLLFCPEEVLQDPQLPVYLMETRKIEDIGEILGLTELEGSTYIVQHYPQTSKLTLGSVKELARKVNELHEVYIYHCFISLETISITDRGLFFHFPCIRPSFFPLVSRLLDPERLNYQLDPNLTPMLIYGIEPQAAELEAADSFAVSLLIQQHCLSELPQLKMGAYLIDFLQSRPSLSGILEALEIE